MEVLTGSVSRRVEPEEPPPDDGDNQALGKEDRRLANRCALAEHTPFAGLSVLVLARDYEK
jgi:hypothetical protein